MYEMVYPIFFWILVVEVAIFCLLNVPTPRGWKGKMIYFLTNNKTIKSIVMFHLIIIFLAIFFYIDSNSQESHYRKQKHRLKHETISTLESERKIGQLSYQIMKIQRNQYITFMLVYVSIALNVYIQIMNYLYKKRDNFQKQQKYLQKSNSSALSEEPVKTPVDSSDKKDK